MFAHMTKSRHPFEHKEAKPGRRDMTEILLHDFERWTFPRHVVGQDLRVVSQRKYYKVPRL